MADTLLVMGVAGCGKSTLARALAKALGASPIEGDDFHSPESQEKMRRGIALQDADREPWLDRLGAVLASTDGGAVLSCSALKARYRRRLRAAVRDLRTVYVDISPAAARRRVAARPDHLFPPGLVASQFAALEVPVDEPSTFRISADLPVDDQVSAVLAWLDRCHDGLTACQPEREGST